MSFRDSTGTTGKRLAITLLALAGFAAVLAWALRDQGQAKDQAQQAQQTAAVMSNPLQGVIALDVEDFFRDERVRKILEENRLPVAVKRMGSRDMHTKVVKGSTPDFFISSGVVAGNRIVEAARAAGVPAVQAAPLHSPMVIASWEPVAQVLVRNGVARQMSPKVYSVDMAKLTQLMLTRKRWKELTGSQGYDVNRSVLVSTTDLRLSNSGALYLALTASAVHGDVIADRAVAQTLALQMSELFKRQGYQENYVDGNFSDYTSIGKRKTPLAFIYEFQMVRHALGAVGKAGIASDMVLMYPSPTIVNKEVFVGTSERARALGDLLSKDAKLQAIAVEYGFRIADAAQFAAAVKPTGLAVADSLKEVVDPPSAEIMAEMIEIVAKEMSK